MQDRCRAGRVTAAPVSGFRGESILGHGRRLRQSHNAAQDLLRVRLGRCKLYLPRSLRCPPAACRARSIVSRRASNRGGGSRLGPRTEEAVRDALWRWLRQI